jgi:Na+/melibiose symporter-like transporter
VKAYLPQWEETLVFSGITIVAAYMLYPLLRRMFGPTAALACGGAFLVLSLVPLLFVDARRRPATGMILVALHLPWLRLALLAP